MAGERRALQRAERRGGGGCRARSHYASLCTAARPFYIRFANVFGASLSGERHCDGLQAGVHANAHTALPGAVRVRLRPGEVLVRNGATIHRGVTTAGTERLTLSCGWCKCEGPHRGARTVVRYLPTHSHTHTAVPRCTDLDHSRSPTGRSTGGCAGCSHRRSVARCRRRGCGRRWTAGGRRCATAAAGSTA